MSTEISDAEKLREVRQTAFFLDKAFQEILESYFFSTSPVRFPAPVFYSNGNSLDSIPKRVASNNVRDGVRKGEIIIAVGHDPTMPIFKIGLFSPIGHEDEALVLALFPPNFRARCVNDGVDPRMVIEDAIAHIVYNDAKLTTEKKRAQVCPPEGKMLVRVFTGSTLPRSG